MRLRDRSLKRKLLLAAILFTGLSSPTLSESFSHYCDPGNGGLAVPEGFCARVFSKSTGSVRNLAIASNGDVFATIKSGVIRDGGVVSLRDNDGDMRADEVQRFGSGSGHGIVLSEQFLYFASHKSIVRWPWEVGQLVPLGPPETVVGGFPKQRSHKEKALALAPSGKLYVSVGAPSNACQIRSRSRGSPGIDPCPQLELHAGIWLYDAFATDQVHREQSRVATGLRHTLAMAIEPKTSDLWGAVNGRDQLGSLWGYSAKLNARLPAEELVRILPSSDFGWPYCYYDGNEQEKVLSPEYGGDGSVTGRCDQTKDPEFAFPAHWAPMGMTFYNGSSFPKRYHGGLFVAFHGSWNRSPLPQEGYQIAFVPFSAGGIKGGFETFAIGQKDFRKFRMTGVAVAPDGALFVADDSAGTIWRIQRNETTVKKRGKNG